MSYVFIGQKYVCTADTCMNPDVEFTVFKIVFYKILIMLGINFITKTELFKRP